MSCLIYDGQECGPGDNGSYSAWDIQAAYWLPPRDDSYSVNTVHQQSKHDEVVPVSCLAKNKYLL